MSRDFSEAANQICILRLSALGDCCHALGAINRLKKEMPAAEITWVIGKNEYQLFKGIDGIEFLVVDKSSLLKAMLTIRQDLRGRRFDVLLNMHASMSANLISAMISSDRKVGFDRARARDKQNLFCNEGKSKFGCFKDKKSTAVTNLDNTLNKIWSIGGETGWYYATWLWRLRALLDKVIGGVGLGNERRDPNELLTGDKIDFWKVLYVNKEEQRLILFAEMKVPGEAWLEFHIKENVLYQTATFRARGIMGRMYWYILFPFHILIFRGLIKKLAA